MNILFDARHLVHEVSGLSRYTYCLLEGLISLPGERGKLEIIVREEALRKPNILERALFAMIDERKSESIVLKPVNVPLFNLKHHWHMRRLVNASDADVYFYPYIDLPWGIKKRCVFVIHDLFPLLMKDYIVSNRFIKTLYYKWIVSRSLAIHHIKCIAVSKSTASDIARFFPARDPRRLRVVYEALVKVPVGENQTSVRSEIRDIITAGPYLFYAGDRRPHKNIPKMIEIFGFLKENYFPSLRFILAGSEKNFASNLETLAAASPGVQLTGRVSEGELNLLQDHMEALFFLSRYEGFGLPILEAAARGRRIITSNLSSLPEVSPPWALLLNPHADSERLAKEIASYLEVPCSATTSAAWVQEKFSWSRAAGEIFDRAFIYA